MTTVLLTDRLLKAALAPAETSAAVGEIARVVSERTRAVHQRRRRLTLPWLLSPAASVADERRTRLVRLALALALTAAAVGAVAAGARLLPPPPAPAQWLLVRQGEAFSVPLSGGERRHLAAFAGLQVMDVSLSWDGTRLATLRGARNEILEVWDAASVFADRRTIPILYALPEGSLILDAGVWRRDGRSLLMIGSERGARRLFMLDLTSGEVRRISPDRLNVDDWQVAPNDRWIEIAGQWDGVRVLVLLDLDTGETRTVMESDGTTIPMPGALGWSPDSARMTIRIEHRARDNGIWSLRPDGTELQRITPVGQPAEWMSWSPDGQWIAYMTFSDRPCAGAGAGSSGRRLADTWVVRADGTEAHSIALSALAMEWAQDSRSVTVESQVPVDGAPLGGVIHAYLDGSPPDLVYPYTSVDVSGDPCHIYGTLTKKYRGSVRGSP